MKYVLIRTNRRSIAVQIQPDGEVVVRAPRSTSQRRIDEFVASKSAWVEKHLSIIRTAVRLPKYTESEINEFVRTAKNIIPNKVECFAHKMGVSYGNVTIRSQRTLWGSCTAHGNLNFNCLLVNAPKEVMDYVIIHELSHRVHMNHSKAFWDVVEKFCPEYKVHRKWLKVHGETFLKRL